MSMQSANTRHMTQNTNTTSGCEALDWTKGLRGVRDL